MQIPIAQSIDPFVCASQLKAAYLKQQNGPIRPELVLFFASSKLDFAAASGILHESFPESQVVGCSTAGEISSGAMTEGSVVAMAISADYIDQAATAFIENPADPADVARAAASVEATLGQPLRDLDPASWVGLVLVDGLSGAEEQLMDKLGNFVDFPFIGGSAGDDLAFRKTWIGHNGLSYGHGAVIAVLHTPKGYRILKAQSFHSTGKRLTATSVDTATRTVLEFNGGPAAEEYASALGVPVDLLADSFMAHPLGLMIGGEPFVRSPQRVNGDGVVFYCNMHEGTEVEILESSDIVADTGATLADDLLHAGTPAALIDFHCILRTLELRAKGQCEQYGQLFSGFPAIGFSTYGEEYMGHINQTSTMLVLPG